MLIPFETIAVILYLASISDHTNSGLNLFESLGIIAAAGILCSIFVLIQTVIILKRGQLYTKRNRLIISICNSTNKALSCLATIALLHYYNLYNLFSEFLPSLSGNYTLQNITGMLIFVFITLLTWIPWYYVHKRTNAGPWSIWSYLLHKFRYTFFILGIWLPGILLTEYISSQNSIISANELELYSTILFLSVAWIFPIFLRKFWGCTPIEDGELKDDILHLTQKAGVRVNGIYLWSLGGKSIPNAAMVGFLPPFQYLFISHGLVKKLKEDEVLGVVAHELDT